MKKTLIISSALTALILTSGCASTPSGPGVLSETDRQKVSYLGRYLLTPDYQKKVENKFEDLPGIVIPGPGTPYYVDMSVALATDSMGWGQVAGSIAFVAGLFTGDGSLDTITQAYISTDKNIETQADANRYIEGIVMDRIHYTSNIVGDGAKCVAGCDGRAKLFEMNITNPELVKEYGDRFDKILVTVNIEDALPINIGSPLSYATNKEVAWATPAGNSLGLQVFGKLRGKEYKIEFDKNGAPYPERYVRDEGKGLTKQVAATITNAEGLIWGTDHRLPYVVSVDGIQYEASTAENATFVWRLLQEDFHRKRPVNYTLI